MGPETCRRARQDTGAHRRQLRPAAERPGDRSHRRPRHGIAPAAESRLDRQHALRCLRPARRLDHLQCLESVSRGDGSRTAVLAEPGHAEGSVDQHRRRHGERQPVDERSRRHRDLDAERLGQLGRIARHRHRDQCGDQRARAGRARSRLHRRGRQHHGRADGAARRLQPLRARATRRLPSTIKARLSPRRFRSTSPPTPRSATATAAIRRAADDRSACRRPSTAASRARRAPSSSP